MKILVTGAQGQLGRETTMAFEAAGDQVIGVGRGEIDFSKPEQVTEAIATVGADWVINCAAYTRVDKAEEEPELAYLVNRDSARAVAEGAKHCGSRLLHVSTDFIFGGDQSQPYQEDDPAKPLGVYGQSKWEGEQAVREVLPDALIMRTAWVYGAHGHNFVKTILRLAAEREELRVVDDQIGTPTWTRDIATAMHRLIAVNASGTYHFTNEGVASWYDFAHEIVTIARQIGFSVKVQNVSPIPTREFPTAAMRPAYSVLNKEKIRSILGYDIPHWQTSLQLMLKELHR